MSEEWQQWLFKYVEIRDQTSFIVLHPFFIRYYEYALSPPQKNNHKKQQPWTITSSSKFPRVWKEGIPINHLEPRSEAKHKIPKLPFFKGPKEQFFFSGK